MIPTLRERYPELVIGLSDHHNGIAMAPVAYMLGARVFEKHFTLNHAWKGTDHAYSLMPDGMRRFVRDLQRVPAALGDGVKRRLPSEERALQKMGKQLVAVRDLPAGHVLTPADLVAKSPADGGLPPYELDDLLGRTLARPLATEQDDHARRSRAGGRGRRRPQGVSDPLFDLGGRVAIVTGGMGQLGQVYAEGLAERGMRVASFDIAPGTLPEVRALRGGHHRPCVRCTRTRRGRGANGEFRTC